MALCLHFWHLGEKGGIFLLTVDSYATSKGFVGAAFRRPRAITDRPYEVDRGAVWRDGEPVPYGGERGCGLVGRETRPLRNHQKKL